MFRDILKNSSSNVKKKMLVCSLKIFITHKRCLCDFKNVHKHITKSYPRYRCVDNSIKIQISGFPSYSSSFSVPNAYKIPSIYEARKEI